MICTQQQCRGKAWRDYTNVQLITYYLLAWRDCKYFLFSILYLCMYLSLAWIVFTTIGLRDVIGPACAFFGPQHYLMQKNKKNKKKGVGGKGFFWYSQ